MMCCCPGLRLSLGNWPSMARTEVRSSRCWGPMLSGESIAKVERRYSRAFNLLPREVVVRVADLQPAQIPLTVL